ncbi:MAG: hypothetical protein O3B13_22780, partial [Planctomycetota bacterium]|nr:hypothetical protein [Planctomycetota bacterium]
MPRNWMARLRHRLARTNRRRQIERCGSPLELLEQRTNLSVSSLVFGGELQIISDADDDIVVGINPGIPGRVQLTVNGVVDSSFPTVQASTLRALTIIGSDADNLINVNAVTSAVFSFV